ncbi:hypothetical protein VVATL9824_03560 [Vibrio vulnificus]|nr:hypothetical protein VVATL9824_03560 [Vibrio vulnificus]
MRHSPLNAALYDLRGIVENNIEKPWITGPKELLTHGLQHLELGTDFDHRIAMISVDNAVELMIKTYLGLPKRISKIDGLTRKALEEINSSFPNMLDGLERFASDKLSGIDLGDIEWFHRVRNQLYHDGNGITVEKGKVEAYAEIAKILFENLFGVEITETKTESKHHSLVGEFIKLWADIERQQSTKDGKRKPMMFRLNELIEFGHLSPNQVERFNEVRKFRNNLVHGMSSPTEAELQVNVQALKQVVEALKLGAV